jgi:hypothetical protein
MKYETEMQTYEGKLRARQDRIDGARENRRTAWNEGKYVKALFYAVPVVWHRYKKWIERHSRPVKELPGVEDCIWQQGQDGEDSLTEFLAQALNDEWNLLRGYKNPKGEVDQILVGPDGIFAVEVKNYKGVISCDGNYWTRNKNDAWGNQVLFDEPITDRGGRSPARQVNDSADLLETFLRKTMPSCRVCRNVILTSAEAEIGALRNLTVDGAFLLRDFSVRDMLRESMTGLTATEVDMIVHQIARDHRYYQQRRQVNRVRRPAA